MKNLVKIFIMLLSVLLIFNCGSITEADYDDGGNGNNGIINPSLELVK